MLNGFGNAENPMHHVLESFLDNYWTPSDRWNIRKKPSDLTKSQREFALSEGGPDDPKYFIKGGFGIAALLSEGTVDVSLETVSILFEGGKALSDAGFESGGLSLIEIVEEASASGSTRKLRGAEQNLASLSDGDFRGNIIDILEGLTIGESPGLRSQANAFGPDFVSEFWNDISWPGEGDGLVGNPQSNWHASRKELSEMYDQFGPSLIQMMTAYEMKKPGSLTSGTEGDAARKSLVMSWLHHAVRPVRFGPQGKGPGLDLWSQKSAQVYWGRIPHSEGLHPDVLNDILATSVFDYYKSVPRDQWPVGFKEDEELWRRVQRYSTSEMMYAPDPDSYGGFKIKNIALIDDDPYPQGVSSKDLISRLKESDWDIVAALEEELRSSATAKAKAFMKHSEERPGKKFKWVDKPLVTEPNLLLFLKSKMHPPTAREKLAREAVAHKVLTKVADGADREIHILPDGAGNAIVAVRPEDAGYGFHASPVVIGNSDKVLTISKETLMDTRPIGIRLMQEAGATPEQIEKVRLAISEMEAKQRIEDLREMNKHNPYYRGPGSGQY